MNTPSNTGEVESGAVAIAATNNVVAARTKLDVVEVTGADAASYLHGQLSQNVERLADGETRWTLLLQPQGKVMAWMRIHRLAADRFLLLVDEGFGAAAQARLERFKLRVDAEIISTPRPVMALRGPAAVELADSLELGDDITVVSADWGGDGIDLVAPSDSELNVTLPPEVQTASPEQLEMIRISRGQPAMGSELDESTIPAAAGVVDASVDFTKGCYVGQELVARIDSRGNNTPTRLVRLSSAAALTELQPGMELVNDGNTVGRITSVAAAGAGPEHQVIGLGYVKRGTEVPGVAEANGTDGPPIVVSLEPLRA